MLGIISNIIFSWIRILFISWVSVSKNIKGKNWNMVNIEVLVLWVIKMFIIYNFVSSGVMM